MKERHKAYVSHAAWFNTPIQTGSEPRVLPSIASATCKQIGVTEQTFYRWQKEYGGLRIDQAKRLKRLFAVRHAGWSSRRGSAGRRIGRRRDAAGLIALPKYHAVLRLLIDGEPSRPFTIRTLPPPPITNDPDRRETIRRVSQRRYAGCSDRPSAA